MGAKQKSHSKKLWDCWSLMQK